MNDRIRADQVLLIAADGEQIGVITIADALARAEKVELDLVEVAPNAEPPVCKIMDYRRHVFDHKRRLKDSRKKSTKTHLKEIKLRPNIDPHDYGIKLKKVQQFLEKGHKVKVTMRYRPREMRHFENGTAVLNRMADDVVEFAEVEGNSRKRISARIQVMVLSKKK